MYLDTTRGNNSYVKYDVTFSDTELVLSCNPGDVDRGVLWTKQDGSVVCNRHNCTLNPDRNLTNDDSGNYICSTSNTNGMEYHSVHINVLGEETFCMVDTGMFFANRQSTFPRLSDQN